MKNAFSSMVRAIGGRPEISRGTAWIDERERPYIRAIWRSRPVEELAGPLSDPWAFPDPFRLAGDAVLAVTHFPSEGLTVLSLDEESLLDRFRGLYGKKPGDAPNESDSAAYITAGRKWAMRLRPYARMLLTTGGFTSEDGGGRLFNPAYGYPANPAGIDTYSYDTPYGDTYISLSDIVAGYTPREAVRKRRGRAEAARRLYAAARQEALRMGAAGSRVSGNEAEPF